METNKPLSKFPNYPIFRDKKIIYNTLSKFFKNIHYMFLRYIKVWFGNWDLWQETVQIIFSTESFKNSFEQRHLILLCVHVWDMAGGVWYVFTHTPPCSCLTTHSNKDDGWTGGMMGCRESSWKGSVHFLNWNRTFSAPCKQERLRPEHALFKIQTGTQTWINSKREALLSPGEAEQFSKSLGDLGKWWNWPTHPLCPSANPP